MRTEKELSNPQSQWQPVLMVNSAQTLWTNREARLRQLEQQWLSARAALDGVDDEREARAQSRADQLCMRHDAALALLLRTPAPNLNAACRKLELAIDGHCDITQLGALLRDLRRLKV